MLSEIFLDHKEEIYSAVMLKFYYYVNENVDKLRVLSEIFPNHKNDLLEEYRSCYHLDIAPEIDALSSSNEGAHQDEPDEPEDDDPVASNKP